jgi:hypothetical protein
MSFHVGQKVVCIMTTQPQSWCCASSISDSAGARKLLLDHNLNRADIYTVSHDRALIGSVEITNPMCLVIWDR